MEEVEDSAKATLIFWLIPGQKRVNANFSKIESTINPPKLCGFLCLIRVLCMCYKQ